jgi:hypothetical protein
MKIYSTNAGLIEDIGLADNDIDGFLRELLESVNREAAQNSNDEALERPVRMSFDMEKVKVRDIPAIVKYQNIINSCLAEAQAVKSEKAIDFFENAKKVLEKDSVHVLSISDSGTGGAGGKFEKGGKFFTLVVSKGRTEKLNLHSAGSFGIGKNAAFAGSELRLVFYSTRFENFGSNKFYCMGKSVLTSWRSDDDQNMNNKIFFVGENSEFEPETDMNRLPSWLSKVEKGLKVSIIAPRIELKNGWAKGYIASLLNNFFVAIHDKRLVFELDKSRQILNESTMLHYFNDRDVIKAAEDSGMAERLDWAKQSTEAFLTGSFSSEVIDINGFGKLEVLIRVAENLPKKVFFIRNGMFITDSLRHFGKPLERFPNTKDFLVIVRPLKDEDDSSKALKRMENPEHNELTSGYIADEAEVEKLRSAMLEVEARVRDIIKKHARMEVRDSKLIDELAEYFPSHSDAESDNSDSDNDPTKIDVSKKKTKKKSNTYEPIRHKRTRGIDVKVDPKRRKDSESNKSRNYKLSRSEFRSLKSGERSWRVDLSGLKDIGQLELSPLETSRSHDTKLVKVINVPPYTQIKNAGSTIIIEVNSNSPDYIDLELDSDSTVIDFRPMMLSRD